ncbi:MAG: polynucleotide kinase-phosphatase, partial [Planctomycetota bacterium]
FQTAYRHYCWNVDSMDDFRLAPFHILATESKCHVEKNHHWHMSEIQRFCDEDSSFLMATNHRFVALDANQPTSDAEHITTPPLNVAWADEATTTDWWMDLTRAGGEGMVVKPWNFIAQTKQNEQVQPAIKCRGKEYLRIIYGPNYDQPENLSRLRKRSLGRKRSLAIREFALGVEALERFVENDTLRNMHQCVFAILALESEPVDPRL